VKALARHVGISEVQVESLHVQDEKLLISMRQKGEQAPHFDRHDTAKRLAQVYTIILYLTEDADSTAFPRFRLDEFAVPEFDEHDVVMNAAEMRQTIERGFLEKDAYDRWPTRVGDMAIFTQATMVCSGRALLLCWRRKLLAEVAWIYDLRVFSSILERRTMWCKNVKRCSAYSRHSMGRSRTITRFSGQFMHAETEC
jgi:hypothetical protein